MKKILTLIPVLVFIFLITACGAAPAPTASPQQQTPPPTSAPAPALDEVVEIQNDSAAYIPPIAGGDDGRTMIYSVDMQLDTTEFSRGMIILMEAVENTGGYVESANVRGQALSGSENRSPATGSGSARRAEYVLQIPSENLSSFLAVVGENFNIVHLNQQAQNITVDVERNESRIQELQEEERRLLEQLEDEDDPRVRPNLERRLEAVQQDIRRAQTDRQDITERTRYSRVAITLIEFVAAPAPLTFGERVGESFVNGANISGFVVSAIIYIFMVLLPVGILTLGIMLAVKAIEKKMPKKEKVNRSYPSIPPNYPPTQPNYPVNRDENE